MFGMRLQQKIILQVALITTLFALGAAYYEAGRQVAASESREEEYQAIQLKNMLPSLIDGFWDLDQDSVDTLLLGFLDSPAVRQVQIIDAQGLVYSGYRRSGPGSQVHTHTEPLLDGELAHTPQSPLLTDRRQMIQLHRLNDVERRLVSPLWHEESQKKATFVGHFVLEYSTEDSIRESEETRLRLILGGLIIAGLIVVTLSYFIHTSVLRPVNQLMEASRLLADGNFDRKVESDTDDELAILAQSFDTMRVKLKNFTENLQIMVDQRTAELRSEQAKIKNILIYINEGILTFNDEFNIDTEVSSHLESLLGCERDQIIGHNLFTTLLNKSKLTSNELDQIRASLDAILGGDLLAFEINEGNLPREIVFPLDSRDCIYALDWIPIQEKDGDRTHKVMLTIRDISRARELEQGFAKEKEARARLLEHVSQIVKVGRNRFERSIQDTLQRVARLKPQLIQPAKVSPYAAFADLHTIKGNMRSLGLKDLADQIHRAEDMVNVWRTGSPLDHPSLLNQLSQFEELTQGYLQTLVTVWGQDTGRYAGRLPAALDLLLSDLGEPLRMQGIRMRRLEVIDEICNWRPESLRLLNDILVHLVSNSVDHGYVLPRRSGMDTRDFALQVHAWVEQHDAKIIIEDEGVGISLERIRDLARSKNLPLNDTDPYELLFQSAVSSANEITLRSGRGMGLFAVRKIVEQQGGKISARAGEKGGFLVEILLPIAVIEDTPATQEAAS